MNACTWIKIPKGGAGEGEGGDAMGKKGKFLFIVYNFREIFEAHIYLNRNKVFGNEESHSSPWTTYTSIMNITFESRCLTLKLQMLLYPQPGQWNFKSFLIDIKVIPQPRIQYILMQNRYLILITDML